MGFTPGRINLNKYRRPYCEYQGGGQRPGSSCPRPPTPQFRNDWGLPLVPGRLPPLFQSHAALNSLPSRGPLVLVMQIFVTPVLLLHYPEITQVAKVWTRHAITLDPGGIQNASRNLKELASVRSCRVGEHLESFVTPRRSRYLAVRAPTTTTSQITNFRAPRVAQHGQFPSLLAAMPWCRQQLNRSATPTYVSTRGTRGRHRPGTGRRV